MEGFFANNGTHLFLKIKDTIYQRTIGKGWGPISREPDGLVWSVLHEKQWQAFKPALADSSIEL